MIQTQSPLKGRFLTVLNTVVILLGFSLLQMLTYEKRLEERDIMAILSDKNKIEEFDKCRVNNDEFQRCFDAALVKLKSEYQTKLDLLQLKNR